jgi:hypothetical protein
VSKRIFSLFRRPAKSDEMSTVQRRIYETAVRQIRARRLIWGEMPGGTAPYDRPENATRRVSLPKRAA